ncbi:MAG: EamA family transporter [Thermoanaerobaculia bacterium]
MKSIAHRSPGSVPGSLVAATGSTLARSRWCVIGAAALFSTGGAAIKGTALTAFQVAGFRSGIAAIAFLLLFREARRGFGWDLLPAAFSYAGTLVCFVFATKMTTSAAAIFLQSTAPIWILLLAPMLLKEKIRLGDLPAVGLAAIGLALVFFGSRDPAATAPQPGIGNVVALVSGLFYALLMITLRRLSRDSPAGNDRSLPATVLGNAIALAFTLPFALPVTVFRASDLASLLYLGVIQIGVAYWLFSKGLSRLPALEVSLLVLLEPVLNPLWTWIFQGEKPTPLALCGGGLMIAALAARVLMQRTRAPQILVD